MTQLLLIGAFWLAGVHPFHVSVCNIDYVSTERSLQITQKIFADDLEEALHAAAKSAGQTERMDVINPVDAEKLESVIASYLEEHLSIIVNGQTIRPTFLGYEREEMALWCYLEVSDAPTLETVTVHSTILTNTFDDQTNIVHIQYMDAVKSMKLAKDYPKDQVVF